MNALDIIRAKAKTHAATYRKFDFTGFMRWVESQTAEWQCWASSRTVAYLNSNRRYNSWRIQVDGRKRRFTICPPEDGPR
jgi:hypothetical protein